MRSHTRISLLRRLSAGVLTAAVLTVLLTAVPAAAQEGGSSSSTSPSSTSGVPAKPDPSSGKPAPTGSPEVPTTRSAEGIPQLKTTDTRGKQPSSSDVERLTILARRSEKGTVRVIVSLDAEFAPEGLLGGNAASAQRSKIASSKASVKSVATRLGGKVYRQFDSIPVVAMELSPSALAAVAKSPGVASIQEDGRNSLHLDVSVPRIGATDVHDRGFTGNGQVVAVIDTGILNHMFVRNVVGEACFVRNNGCPNGQSSQTGTGAAAACTGAAGCDHGTHVAGIAAGASYLGMPAPATPNMTGVAPGARIMPVRVFSTGTTMAACGTEPVPCVRSSDSDVIAALTYVFNQRENFNIAAVNMSLGSGNFMSACDTSAYKPIIDNLRSFGIATVASSGNDSQTSGIGEPACVSTVISVGAVDDGDVVRPTSNSAPILDLLAPGTSIVSSVQNGFGVKSGTSMAAPHVAGAIALFRQRFPVLPLNTIEADLKTTGVTVTDTRPGAGNLQRPRIRIDRAMALSPVDLNTQLGRNYRNPTPNEHEFQTLHNKRFWSVVAVAPDPGVDVDLRVLDSPTSPSGLGVSNAPAGQIDLVALDGNAGRRADSWDYPRASYSSGSGRYKIRYANPGALLPGAVTNLTFGGDTIFTVFDTWQAAGGTYGYRVVPLQGQDTEMMVMTSDPADWRTWVKGRSQASAQASNRGAGGAESLSMVAPRSSFAGLIVNQKSGCCTYKLYADGTAPSGVTVINGGVPTTSSPTVSVALNANDQESGMSESPFDGHTTNGGGGMRVAADGVVDTEAWEPYATQKTVTLPNTPGIRTVAIQLRNNAGLVTTVSDTIELLPTPTPDLSVLSIGNPPSSALVGGSFAMTDTTRNSGTASAPASTTRFYLSTNDGLDFGDILLSGGHAVPSLAAGNASHTATSTLQMPSTTTPGTYYVIGCADDTRLVAENLETNNCSVAWSSRINVVTNTGPANLWISAMNHASSVGRGGAFTATETTLNGGGTAAGASTTQWYLSVDRTADASDTRIGSRTAPALAPGAGSGGALTLTVPSTATPGFYWLIVCADSTNVVAESVETNNCTTQATQFRVT